MFSNVWRAILSFFSLAIMGVTVRNTVLARAMGTSRLISLVDNTTNTAVFGVLLTIIMEMSCTLNFFAYHYLVSGLPYAEYLKPLCIVLCISASFLLMMLLCAKLAPAKYLKASIEALPFAAFNCTVTGTVVLTITSNLTLVQSLGFGLGASVGFVLAVILATEAQRKLQNRDMPGAWKGVPATLLVLGALALALYALSGYQPPLS